MNLFFTTTSNEGILINITVVQNEETFITHAGSNISLYGVPFLYAKTADVDLKKVSDV